MPSFQNRVPMAKQKFKITHRPATLRQRGSLTVWLDEFCYCNMEQQRTPPEGRG
ncbi:IS903 transposase [Salmonella enterica subsp. enterica serovar Choleraesuis str. SCSA50]|uniref:IS903 transposase n=4 Tax=Salmonella enterica I TaxID=59201 RepID=Q57SC7_SALCH|nr:IS903 transposase [Salmonella enterica subsp. enterica serovar Choleraesuis str. SC-B67]EFZ05080.1 IS903 transposase [Salmonella enterica subsp. enterica serovar Choleraesuis str. SCSA50]